MLHASASEFLGGLADHPDSRKQTYRSEEGRSRKLANVVDTEKPHDDEEHAAEAAGRRALGPRRDL